MFSFDNQAFEMFSSCFHFEYKIVYFLIEKKFSFPIVYRKSRPIVRYARLVWTLLLIFEVSLNLFPQPYIVVVGIMAAEDAELPEGAINAAVIMVAEDAEFQEFAINAAVITITVAEDEDGWEDVIHVVAAVTGRL